MKEKELHAAQSKNRKIVNSNQIVTPSQPAAKAGSWEQAKEGLEKNKNDLSAKLDGAVNAVTDLASGKGDIVSASLAIVEGVNEVKSIVSNLSQSLMMPLMTKLAAFKPDISVDVAKQLDPVLGIDVHMVNIPPNPGPTPMPHIFVGMLFKAKDWVSCLINNYKKDVLDALPEGDPEGNGALNSLATHKEAVTNIVMQMLGLNASVLIGGFTPRAVTGTPTKNIFHIPMGAGFHPVFVASVAKNHGKAFLGSLFVAADGDPFSGMFHLNYDCWDIGITDFFKFKRSGAKSLDPETPLAHLYVPSGVILPIPWNRKVTVNAVPTPINPLNLIDHLFKAGLGKLKNAAKKKIDKHREATEARIKKLEGKVPCAALTYLSKKLGTGQSHPVDVAEGYFYTDNEDFALPGPIPLAWERTWYSYSNYKGPLGHGWHHCYDMAIGFDLEEGIAQLRMADGRGVVLTLPDSAEKATFNRKEKLWMHLHKEGYYYVTDADNLIYRFTKKEYYIAGTPVAQHLLQSIANTNGFAIRFTYNNNGWLQSITDSAGRLLNVLNDKQGRITTINAPHPYNQGQTFVIAHYSYNSEGDMTAHTDALKHPMLFEYSNHQMIKEVWRNGLTWHFVYNGNGTGAKCVEVWGDGNLLHYTFDYSNPECTVATNSLGHKKTFYHHKGLVTRYLDPAGGEWQYHYNQYNELEWTTDPLGNHTGYTHDDWGNTVTITEPDGQFTRIEFHTPGFPTLPSRATDARGGLWTWKYDRAGNLLKRTNPLKAISEFHYKDGLLCTITGNNGAETKLRYNLQHQLQSITAPNGAQTHYHYDELGHCLQIINPKGARRISDYDLLGRTTNVQDFDGNLINLRYDAIDNVILYRDKQKEVHYTYSGLWKLHSRTEAGTTIRFSYDTEDQLRKVINEHGLAYNFELDGVGNVTAEESFDGMRKTFERNLAGWVTKINRPASRHTAYTHDEAGRITTVTYHDNTTETYTYDRGALRQAINADATVTFERDIMGNVVKEICNGYEVSSLYDSTGNRTHISSSMGADIDLGYDIMGDVVVQWAMGWTSETKRDIFGLEIEKELLGGVLSKQERDNIGRIQSHWVGASNGGRTQRAKHFRQYHWDINDRLKQITDQNTGTTIFEHDKWGNLNKTIFNNGEEQLRNPDAVGNIFETKDRRDRKYNRGGQLKESKTAFYFYDDEGFFIEKKCKNGNVWKYEWTAAGMLQKVIRPDGFVVSFGYDALGRRVWKKFKKTITRWIWDGNKPMHEWKEFDAKDGTTDLITWIFEENSFTPAAKIKGEKKYSLICDHLGTPTQGYNEEGSLIWERQLDGYGKVRMLKGDEGFCDYLYQGQTLDAETGLCYNRFRYYSAEEGIYISQDPIGLFSGQPNFYAYVHDPNTWIDPFGLQATYRDANGRFRGAQDAHEEINGLPNFAGKKPGEIRKTLRNRGYTSVPANSGGEVWTKPLADGNTVSVRIDPAVSRTPARNWADERPHAHIETVPTSSVSGGNYVHRDVTSQHTATGAVSSRGTNSNHNADVHIPMSPGRAPYN